MTRVIDDKQIFLSVVFYDMGVDRMVQFKLWISNVSKFRNCTPIVEALSKDFVQPLNLDIED
jgi:hypothetical protein